MATTSNHTFVYGASGLIGRAIVDQLLQSYPTLRAFNKVTAVTNRPLSASESHWPRPNLDCPALQLVSGIDLSRVDGVELAKSLTKAAEDIDTVTHIFYLVFTAIDDDIEEVATNLRMFKNVVDAHELASPNLQFVAFAGGTRGYGIYAPGGTFAPPLTEDMVNNLPADMPKLSCTQPTVGFTPNGSQFGLALHWAQYLSLYAYNHGIRPGSDNSHSNAKTPVEVPFPGNSAGASSLFSPVSSTTIARFMIYASLHPDSCGHGQLFNIADSDTSSAYGALWPQLAAWSSLVGVGSPIPSTASNDNDTPERALGVIELPQQDSAATLTPGAYVAKYKHVFEEAGSRNAVTGGVGAGTSQFDSVGYWLTFDRQMSLKRLRGTGFHGDVDPVGGWLDAFRIFKEAGLVI